MSEQWRQFFRALGTVLLQAALILAAIFVGLYLFAGLVIF